MVSPVYTYVYLSTQDRSNGKAIGQSVKFGDRDKGYVGDLCAFETLKLCQNKKL